MLKTEHFANVTQITIERENNLFLVEEKDGLILVDTAVESPEIKEVIELIQTHSKPLKAIAITHSHDDHLGGLAEIKQAFPDVPLLFPEREYQLIQKKELFPDEKQTPLKEGIPDQLPVEPDMFLREGDRVGELQTIFTPGHTPGHICFYHPALHYILVGDVMQTLGGAAICGVHRDAFPKPARLNWDLPLSIEMVQRMQDLEPQYIGTGHGDVLQDAASHLPAVIEEAKQVAAQAHQ